MGATTSDLMEKHGKEEYVVLHNLVMVRDEDDAATDPKDYTYAPKNRGDRVTLDGLAAKRLLAEGAIAKAGEDSSNFAEAGMRDPSVLAAPPSATQLSPESERVMAVKAAVGERFGDPGALYKLDTHQLKHVAIAFGIPFKADATKEDLAQAILGQADASDANAAHEEAVTAREAARIQSDLHPDDQIEGREASFADQENSGGSGESSDSGDDGSSSGVKASKSAQKFAAEHDIPLTDVQGTGRNGEITQADVVKYHADHSTGD